MTRALTEDELRTLYHQARRAGDRHLMKWAASEIRSITEANDARAAESHLTDDQPSCRGRSTA